MSLRWTGPEGGRKAGRKNDLVGAPSMVPSPVAWPILLGLSGMNLGVWAYAFSHLLGLR